MEYQIKNFKTFKGHEGEPCAQGAIYKDKQKIAEWSDDSWGGPLIHRFINKEEENLFLEYAKKYLSTKKDYNKNTYKPEEMNPYLIIESAISIMSYEYETNKKIEKMCKKKIVFSIGDDKENIEIYSINIPYTEENIKKVKQKHSNIIEIFNEKFNTINKETTSVKPPKIK